MDEREDARPYQLELLKHAEERNVIAYLDTGSGKTLVSILLMERFWNNRSAPFQPISRDFILDEWRRQTLDQHPANTLPDSKLFDDVNSTSSAPTTEGMSASLQHAVDSAENSSLRSMSMKEKDVDCELVQGISLPKLEKRVLFCVPTIPLVHQQAEKIRRNTELAVAEYSGDDNASLSYWDPLGWYYELAQRQVLVITPQTLLNILRHGFLSLSNHVGLLIFDECHHALKGHPYCLIMKEFYHTIPASNERPRVFGMTASPIGQKTFTRELSFQRLKELEATLDCTVVTVSERSSLEGFIAKAREFVLEYPPPPKTPPSDSRAAKFFKFHFDRLQAVFDWCKSSNDTKLASDLGRFVDGVRGVVRELGVLAAGLAAMRHCHNLTFGNERKRPKHAAAIPHKDALGAILSTGNDTGNFEYYDSPPLKIGPDNNSKPPSVEELEYADLTPKCWTLVDVIVRRTTNASAMRLFRGMIFVEKRTTASLLSTLLTLLAPCYFPSICCDYITGRGSSSVPINSMSAPLQMRVLEKFKTGSINLLVVTNVAEEGIDIPACKVVVIFNRFRSNTGYVQSRGRARDVSGAEYILMVQQNDVNTIGVYTQAKVAEVMTQTIAAESSLFDPTVYKNVTDNKVVDAMIGANDVYVTSMATASFSSAEGILRRYVKKPLQYELVFNSYDPESDWQEYKKHKDQQDTSFNKTVDENIDKVHYGFAFSTRVMINETETCIFGSVRFTRKLAMQSAALEAVKFLHINGALNEHLLPTIQTKSKAKTFSMRRAIQQLLQQNMTQSGVQDAVNAMVGVEVVSKVFTFLPHLPNELFSAQSRISQSTSSQSLYLTFFKFPDDYGCAFRSQETFIHAAFPGIRNNQKETFALATFQTLEYLDNLEITLFVSNEPLKVTLLHNRDVSVDVDTSQLAFLQEFGLKFWSYYKQTTDTQPIDPNNSTLLADYFLIPVQLSETNLFWKIDWIMIELWLSPQPLTVFDWTAYLFSMLDSMQDQLQPSMKSSIPRKSSPLETPATNQGQNVLDKAIEELLDILDSNETSNPLPKVPVKPAADAAKATTKKRKRVEGDNMAAEADITPQSDDATFSNLFLRALQWKYQQDDMGAWETKIESITKAGNQFLGLNAIVGGLAVTTPHNGERYDIIGAAHDLNAESPFNFDRHPTISNFLEYFEMLGYNIEFVNTCLVDATRGRYPTTHLRLRTLKPFKSPTSVNLIMECAHILPISRRLMEIALLAPSIMARVESLCLAHHIREKLEIPKVSLMRILEAITSTTVSDVFSYERLETLGDAFLKVASSADLYQRFPDATEGKLSDLRGVIVCNSNLAKCAVALGVGSWIITQPYHPRFWCFPGMPCDINSMTRAITEKKLADVVEALLGAVCVDFGFNEALRLAIRVGVLQSDSPMLINPNAQPEMRIATRHNNFLENTINYKFRTESLAEEAMTHVSYNSGSTYERLEFLGDALLDWLVMRQFFTMYPHIEPDKLSELRQTAVNNDSFCMLAVSIGLFKFVRFNSVPMDSQIKAYVNYINSNPDIHPTETTIGGPKVLGDVFESICGAIWVDCNWNIDESWKIISPLMTPFLERHVTLEIVQKSIVRQLYEFLQKLGVLTKDIKYSFQEEWTNPEIGIICCEISIYHHVAARETSNSKQLAKRRACALALDWAKNNVSFIEGMAQAIDVPQRTEPTTTTSAQTLLAPQVSKQSHHKQAIPPMEVDAGGGSRETKVDVHQFTQPITPLSSFLFGLKEQMQPNVQPEKVVHVANQLLAQLQEIHKRQREELAARQAKSLASLKFSVPAITRSSLN